MNKAQPLQETVFAQIQLCRQRLNQVLLWLAVLLSLIVIAFYANDLSLALDYLPIELPHLAVIIVISSLIIFAFSVWQYLGSKGLLTAYEKMRSRLESAHSESSIANIQSAMSEANALAKSNHLMLRLLEHYQPVLNRRITFLYQQSMLKALDKEHALLEVSCKNKIYEIVQQVPLVKASNQITTSLTFLTTRRDEITTQWEAAYKEFSWWNQFKYGGGPDFTEIDKAIDQLTQLQKKLETDHADDFNRLDNHFKTLEEQALTRISDSKTKAAAHIRRCNHQDSLDSGLLKKAFWLSAMTVPFSLWSDVNSAKNVYDALRDVNGNFTNMSDTEIWWESLFLPTESIAGLAALTKGAYFEQLVAADTSGQLFEHFNNPDTDIVIDGIAFQLKATDSESYIYSVDESIPVIATSEVAFATGVINSGYSNEELSDTVDNALGGTVVDIGDTTADAILGGLGGLGVFATIEGINHAALKLENGGHAIEALFEGAGVAIEGTARALFGAAEMSYRILASKPSRFVGRTLLKGLVKLDLVEFNTKSD